MRIVVLTALTVLLVAAAPVADAAPRSGTTSEGTRITLDGRTLSFRVPARVPRGSRVDVVCGVARPSRPVKMPERTVRARGGERLRVRMPRAAAGAEFCGFGVSGRDVDLSGAAVLGPRPAAIPPVVSGPDVREGVTGDADEIDGSELEGDAGDGRFLLRDRILTVRLRRPFRRSTIVAIVCGKGDDVGTAAFRNVVVRRGTRVVTGDIGPVRPDIDFCLIEDNLRYGDVAVAGIGPPGAPALIADPPAAPRPVIAAGEGRSPARLQVQTLHAGRGARRSRDGDELLTHYVGATWSEGKEFDASWDRGAPFGFTLGSGQVIEGWDRGLAGMRVGERRRIVIPPGMAYGSAGSPPAIGPDETLVFVVDLIRIER